MIRSIEKCRDGAEAHPGSGYNRGHCLVGDSFLLPERWVNERDCRSRGRECLTVLQMNPACFPDQLRSCLRPKLSKQIQLVEQAHRYGYQNFLFHDVRLPVLVRLFATYAGKGEARRVKREVSQEDKRLGARA